MVASPYVHKNKDPSSSSFSNHLFFIAKLSVCFISSLQMMASQDIDPVSKLAKPNNSEDYILWKRRVFAYIRRNDAELLGFQAEPASNALAIRKKWFEFMIKANSTIVLCICIERGLETSVLDLSNETVVHEIDAGNGCTTILENELLSHARIHPSPRSAKYFRQAVRFLKLARSNSIIEVLNKSLDDCYSKLHLTAIYSAFPSLGPKIS